MKKFLLKSLAFILLTIIVSGFYCLYVHNYLLANPNKYLPLSHRINFSRSIERLKTKTDPTIIIIGGSGCGFGFISQDISEHYEMPVINTGTHIGFGLQLMMNAVEPYVTEGDIVLLIPEYTNFTSNYFWGEELALDGMYSNPELFDRLSLLHLGHLLTFYPKYYQLIKDYEDDIVDYNTNDTICESPYNSCSLNEYGDVTLFELRKHKNGIALMGPASNPNKTAVRQTKKFISNIEKKGATCIFLPCAYRDKQYDFERDFINVITEMFENNGIPYQVKTERYRLPDSLFYDTSYHLTYSGCKLRTQLVIEDVDSILSKKSE